MANAAKRSSGNGGRKGGARRTAVAAAKQTKQTRSLLDFIRPGSRENVDSSNFTKSSKQETKSKSSRKRAGRSAEDADGSSNDLVDLLSSDDDMNSLKRTRSSEILPGEGPINPIAYPAAKKVKFEIPRAPVSSSSSSLGAIRQPWVDKYEPLTASKVAVHSRKLDEIRKIMTEMINGTSFTKILILSGPSGASKSATIKAVARDLGLHVNRDGTASVDFVEWQNPDKTENVPLSEAFSDFLNGLTFGLNLKLVLVEDIPNMTHLETKYVFNTALLQWICNPRKLPPIIICFTEIQIIGTRDFTSSNREASFVHNDSWVVERMFNRQLLDDYRVKRIKMLPVNATLIAKTLKSIVQSERDVFSSLKKRDIDATIKSLANSGDIRSAICALEFWACWSRSSSSSSSSSSPSSSIALPSTKNNVLDVFHAVGRVLHGSKLMEDGPALESVVLDWCDSNADGSFNSALFENYLGAKSSQMDLSAISLCSGYLSDASLLVSASAEITTELACRGLRTTIANSKLMEGSQKTFRQLTFAPDKRIGLNRLKAAADYDSYSLSLTQNTGTILPYMDVILYNGFFESKIKTSAWRRRIGGAIALESTGPVATLDDDDNYNGNDDDDSKSILNLTHRHEAPSSPTHYIFSDDDIEFD